MGTHRANYERGKSQTERDRHITQVYYPHRLGKDNQAGLFPLPVQLCVCVWGGAWTEGRAVPSSAMEERTKKKKKKKTLPSSWVPFLFKSFLKSNQVTSPISQENEETFHSTYPVCFRFACHTWVTHVSLQAPSSTQMLSLLLTSIVHYWLETSMAGIICFSFSLKVFANMLGG